MRYLRHVFVVGLAAGLAGCAPAGHIRRQWVQPNEQVDQHRGVGFYHDFVLEWQKGQQCYLEVRLADKSRRPIPSDDGRYESDDTRQVAARRVVTCFHDRLDGTNLRVFIPYDQLELPAGRHPVVMESRLVAVRDKKVLDVRYHPVTVDVPTELARAPRARRAAPHAPGLAQANGQSMQRVGEAQPRAKRAPRREPGSQQMVRRVSPPVQRAKPNPPPPPPPPAVYWFIRHAQVGRITDGTLRGPYASRAAGEIALRSYPGKLVAKAPSDRVWLSTCFDLQSKSKGVRIIGPYESRQDAERARDDLRQRKSSLGWAFSEVATMRVNAFVEEYASRRGGR